MASVMLAQLRIKALDLPENERAELAHDILLSLDGPADEGVEPAWAAEVEQRIADMDSGQVEAMDADEVSRRIVRRIRCGQ